jgi:hypothetical protein
MSQLAATLAAQLEDTAQTLRYFSKDLATAPNTEKVTDIIRSARSLVKAVESFYEMLIAEDNDPLPLDQSQALTNLVSRARWLDKLLEGKT